MDKYSSLAYRLAVLGISVFFLSMTFAGAGYALTRPMRFHEAIICSLASPQDNPHWYRVAGIGALLSGLMMLPVAIVLYLLLRRVQHGVAVAGLAIFSCGVIGGVALCFSTSFFNHHHRIHSALAFATYTALAAGISLWMILSASHCRRLHSGRAMALALGGLGNAAIVITLFYLWFHKSFFSYTPWYHAIATWEWGLTGYNALCLMALILSARLLERAHA